MTSEENTPPLELDVRPVLARGGDPFPEIMTAKDRLTGGQALLLIAPFKPLPLFNLFTAEGYGVQARQEGPDEWHILFSPAEGTKAGHSRELDVRHLEPPLPLETALKALSTLEREETLILHTRFRPAHLFEQIEDNGYEFETEETAPLHWITHVWRMLQ